MWFNETSCSYSGLDLSSYVVNEDHDKPMYDLFAVSNHFGGLGGGHCELLPFVINNQLIIYFCFCFCFFFFQILHIVRTNSIATGTPLMIVMFLKLIQILFV